MTEQDQYSLEAVEAAFGDLIVAADPEDRAAVLEMIGDRLRAGQSGYSPVPAPAVSAPPPAQVEDPAPAEPEHYNDASTYFRAAQAATLAGKPAPKARPEPSQPEPDPETNPEPTTVAGWFEARQAKLREEGRL